MPVGEIVGELLGGVFKFLGRLFIEFVIELIIKGSGYLICRMFSKDVDPDGVLVILVGLMFIGMVGWGIYFVYDYVQLQLAMDHCFDSGGELTDGESNNDNGTCQ